MDRNLSVGSTKAPIDKAASIATSRGRELADKVDITFAWERAKRLWQGPEQGRGARKQGEEIIMAGRGNRQGNSQKVPTAPSVRLQAKGRTRSQGQIPPRGFDELGEAKPK